MEGAHTNAKSSSEKRNRVTTLVVLIADQSTIGKAGNIGAAGDVMRVMTWRRRIGWAVALAGAGMGLCLAAGVMLCENAVHVRKRATAETTFAGVNRRDVQIVAGDGAVLRGWLFTPEASNGNVVMVLHGISDSRGG
jgi:hypothetical protein